MHKPENEIITIVLVLYKTAAADCLSYKTLVKQLASSTISYQLIFYNNSPEITLGANPDYTVVNSEVNSKFYGAYNFALHYALEHNSKWLLLLDQDTEITAEYIQKLELFLHSHYRSNTVAVVPVLTEGTKILSPKRISSCGWWQYRISGTGYQSGRIIAFNSLTLISVEFMHSLGGFSDKYPLDMLDHWYYNQIFKHNKTVFILDTQIRQRL